MIRAVHIARFRGIRECVADGLGRVNLVIGKNDCGKTAFMEAVALVDDAENAARSLLSLQRARLGRGAKSLDFERFWRPLFVDLQAKIGFSVAAVRDDGTLNKVDVRQGAVTDDVIVDRSAAGLLGDNADSADDGVLLPTWSLEIHLTTGDRAHPPQRIVATPTRLRLPSGSGASGGAWIATRASAEEHEIRSVSAMKQRGQDLSLVELLREVDGRVSGIELLAPGGDVAELFVRLDDGTPMLPVALMGDGFQRCLALGAAAAAHDWPTLFIDEIENGMHHLVLEPLWRWIATTARRRNLQVFATTHSEECIHAASRAFEALGDDGLRVIRLDRLDSGTRAAVYDRSLIETAERTGTELRG